MTLVSGINHVAIVTADLGAMHALWFSDPDGMRGEVCLIVDPELRGFHAPTPLATS